MKNGVSLFINRFFDALKSSAITQAVISILAMYMAYASYMKDGKVPDVFVMVLGTSIGFYFRQKAQLEQDAQSRGDNKEHVQKSE